MNLPNNEHIETRFRELKEGIQRLLPLREPSMGFITTLGDPLPCGCCYSPQAFGACTSIQAPEQLQSLIIGTLTSLILTCYNISTPPSADEGREAWHRMLDQALDNLEDPS